MKKFILTTEDENGNKKELSQVNNVKNGSNLTEIDVKKYEQNLSIYHSLYNLTYNLHPFFDIIKTTFEDILEKNGSIDVELSSEFNRVKSFIPYPAMPSTFFTILDDIIYGDWVINFVKFIAIIQFCENNDISEFDKNENIMNSEVYNQFYNEKVTSHENRITMNVQKVLKYYQILVECYNTYFKF